MSNRRKSYILTETAVCDFREARRWSVARWGKKRTKSYFQQLHNGADYIATHQLAMAARDDLTENTDLGVYAVGEHYLVYVPMSDTQIIIVALIRQTRDVPAILKANSFQIRRQLAAEEYIFPIYSYRHVVDIVTAISQVDITMLRPMA